ncbi:MAG TPA: VOC family protein [Puia sp.]|nr:VOC family protein [Puia sp.]
MTKEIWLNLPVKDVNKSKEFFTKLGFSFDSKYETNGVNAALKIGQKNIVVMLFAEHMFKNFSGVDIADTTKYAEILISIDAESQEEVDEFAKKVEAAGGNLFHKPAENQGWMYGCAFADLDGHRWNMLYMDMSKMPKH